MEFKKYFSMDENAESKHDIFSTSSSVLLKERQAISYKVC